VNEASGAGRIELLILREGSKKEGWLPTTEEWPSADERRARWPRGLKKAGSEID